MNSKFLIRFAFIGLVNALVFYLANLYYPQNVVLGNANFGKETAAIVTGFLLAVLGRIPKPLIMNFGVTKVQGRLPMLGFYFLYNSVAIWLLARIAPISGFGITNFYFAFGIAFAATLFQWLARQIFKALKLVPAKK